MTVNASALMALTFEKKYGVRLPSSCCCRTEENQMRFKFREKAQNMQGQQSCITTHKCRPSWHRELPRPATGGRVGVLGTGSFSPAPGRQEAQKLGQTPVQKELFWYRVSGQSSFSMVGQKRRMLDTILPGMQGTPTSDTGGG